MELEAEDAVAKVDEARAGILLHGSAAIFRGFQQLQALMPNFIEQWTNMMAASFQGFVLFGYSHPLVELFLIAVVVSIGTEAVAEIESKSSTF